MNPTIAMNLDDYNDFYIVVESFTENKTKPEILSVSDKSDGLKFLRFRTCLQSFIGRNRNRRDWPLQIMQQMMNAPEVLELLKAGGVPGESGHPIPATGSVTVERIVTIDPNNLSHITKSYEWVGKSVFGIVETIDDGEGGPGRKFMNNILQGMDPSFSVRSIVPQRKNRDGTIDVTGLGRFITHDRVILPSDPTAYIDKNIPIKNVTTKNNFETVMESYCSFLIDRSDKINRIVDGMQPAMESASLSKDGTFSVRTNQGIAIIKPENKFRNEIRDFMKSF